MSRFLPPSSIFAETVCWGLTLRNMLCSYKTASFIYTLHKNRSRDSEADPTRDKLGFSCENHNSLVIALLFGQIAQSQVLSKHAKWIQSRSRERRHLWSSSRPNPNITKTPLRLLSEDITVIVTCGKFASMCLRCSLLIVYMSVRIKVLSSRTNNTPPLRFKSSCLVRDFRRVDVAFVDAAGILMLSYVQTTTTTYLCIRCV
jgi:hypothetical protein